MIVATEGEEKYETTIAIRQKRFFVFKGSLQGLQYIDGGGADATFDHIASVTIDSADNLLINDSSLAGSKKGNNAIRKISPSGLVSTVFDLTNMNLDGLDQLAVDHDNNLYASGGWSPPDYPFYVPIKIIKISPDNSYSTVVGSIKGNSDGIGTNARFNNIAGFTIDPTGNIFLTDPPTIRKVDGSGLVTTISGAVGSSGYYDTQGTQARFDKPTGITRDSLGNLYVYDSGLIRKIDTSINVSTFYNANLSGTNDRGTLAIDLFDNLYAAPEVDAKPITQISPSAIRKDFLATHANPHGLAVDSKGNIFFADDHKIQKLTISGEISAFAGKDPVQSSPSDLPISDIITSDKLGNIYIAITGGYSDQMGHRGEPYGYEFYKVTPDGNHIKLPVIGGRPEHITGLAVDEFGNKYITQDEAYNSSVGLVTKITPDGQSQIIAGDPLDFKQDSVDGVGVDAHFYQVKGLTIDSSGNLYVLEIGGAGKIRKVTPSGVVKTIVPNLALDRQFGTCNHLVLDKSNNLFFIESGRLIKKVNPTGDVSLLAGSLSIDGEKDGAGANAAFDSPSGLSIDANDNIYVMSSSTLRKVTPNGVVTTVAGVWGSRQMQLGDLPGKLNAGFLNNSCAITMIGGNSLVFGRGQSLMEILLP